MRSHRSSSSGWTARARDDAMTAPWPPCIGVTASDGRCVKGKPRKPTRLLTTSAVRFENLRGQDQIPLTIVFRRERMA